MRLTSRSKLRSFCASLHDLRAWHGVISHERLQRHFRFAVTLRSKLRIAVNHAADEYPDQTEADPERTGNEKERHGTPRCCERPGQLLWRGCGVRHRSGALRTPKSALHALVTYIDAGSFPS